MTDLYKLVLWPESQFLMDHPRFSECLFIDYIDGHEDVGSSAYVCPVDLYEEIFHVDSTRWLNKQEVKEILNQLPTEWLEEELMNRNNNEGSKK